MKKSKFTESQIAKALKEYEGGRKVDDLCRELGVTAATFYYWKKKYLGIDSEQLRRLKELKSHINTIDTTSFNSCLLNLYHNGSEGMSWHSDNEKEIVQNTRALVTCDTII